MKKIRKYNKTSREIQKKITEIIYKKFSYINNKNNLLSINNINISKNLKYIYIYIYIICLKKKKKYKNIVNFLKKKKTYIKNILKKKINFKFISDIYFKFDNFIKKEKKINYLIKKANNKINK